MKYDGQWDWQRCTELQPDSFWFAANGVTDAFWPAPYNASFTTEHCAAAWGVTPTLEAITTSYDLPYFKGVSIIVFTNGLYDSWSGASLQVSPDPSRDLIVLNVSGGGHHLDLFFSHPEDPQSVRDVRTQEVTYMRKWVAAAAGARARAATKAEL